MRKTNPGSGRFLRLLVVAGGLSMSVGAAHAQSSEGAAPQPAPAVTPAPQAMPASPAPAFEAPPVTQPAAPAQAEAPAAPQAAAPAPTGGETPVVQGQAAPAPAAPEATAEPAAEQGVFDQILSPRRDDLPHDLSPIGMFLAADWVVKSVMIALALASVATWTVWLAKTLELMGARRRALHAIHVIGGAKSLDDAVRQVGKRAGPSALMVRIAAEEVHLSEGAIDHTDGAGLKERVSSALSRIEARAGRRMMRGTGILATTGSIAPFVGLFGTVWGIMNSFIGISESQTTNLAVVAPGIAEALLATAIGLVAAIPAVIIYNVFARSITGYRQLLIDAASGVERLVSRDLDYRKAPPGARKTPVSLAAE